MRGGSETPTPAPGRATPNHTNRRSIDENTPPSDRMLALHSMRARAESEAPLSNITNSAVGGSGNNTNNSSMGRIPHTVDALSSQILSLTSIATNLQKEMAALSRRSKDNATDLCSLKEATNLRDEDIRKSLKDLVFNLDTKLLTAPSETSHSTPTRGLYLDNKAHNVNSGRKNISLPRIPSPNSFTGAAAMERELTASPSLVSSDGAASIALLEKVLREMGTKEGQEGIMKSLERVKAAATAAKPSGDGEVNQSLMKKLEEILKLLKDESSSRALVRSAEHAVHDGLYAQNMALSRSMPAMNTSPSAQMVGANSPHSPSSSQSQAQKPFVNDELFKILKGVKQSVSEGGGLTNEVKALVRELRGEVLGMGREIARKLEQAEAAASSVSQSSSNALSREVAIQGPGREEIGQIVGEGLHELQQNMAQLIRENRRESAASHKSNVDTQEIVVAVRRAFGEIQQQLPSATTSRDSQEFSRDPAAEREQMLVAVREAWEDCKPEIALEHFGLERDEILDTLKEGLKSYQPTLLQEQQQSQIREVGASYDEVLEAVKRGLADFRPPSIHTEASLTREEILVTVRECLENFEFPMPVQPASSSVRESDLTREDVVDAVREGMDQQSHVTKEIEFNRDDLFDAVKAGLEGAPDPLGGVGEQVLDQMHQFLGSMKSEFKQYSAANGKDTEQVLDAMKDGLEGLRGEIESYVDRAADVTGKDEIIDTIKEVYRLMQGDLEQAVSSASRSGGGGGGNMNMPELLDAMEKEFEHLRESITRSLSRETVSNSDREEILDAIRELAEERGGSSLGRVNGNGGGIGAGSDSGEDIAKLVKEELEHMRSTLAGTLVRSGSNLDREEVLEVIREGMEINQGHASRNRTEGNESILSNTSELLDAFQDGVDGIRADMERLTNRPVDSTTSYEILDTLKAGLDSVRSDIERLHVAQRDLSDMTSTKGREVMVHDENVISSELEGLKVMITQLRIKIEAMDNAPSMAPPEAIPQDDLDELRASLRDVHAAVQQLHEIRAAPPVVDEQQINAASKDDIEAIETLLRNVKAKIDDVRLPDMDELAKTNQLDLLEDLLRDTKSVVEQSSSQQASQLDHASKEDVGIVEVLLKEVVVGVEELQDKVKTLSSDDSRVTKTDVQVIETLCLDTKTQLDDFTSVDFAALPDKDDFKTVHETINTFREKVEAENELTAQAFEARKIEHGGLASKIDDVKSILSDVRGELIGKLDGSEEGLVELSKVLGHHHESMSKYASAESISELRNLIDKGFDNSGEQHKKSSAETEERDAALMFKHDEAQGAICAEVNARIDERFNELMTKYDDAQLSNEGKLNTLEERDGKHLEALTSTQTVVDDLKLLIETLGTTTTETCDRISDDSKTVFNQVADANGKLEDLHQTALQQHDITRDEVAKTLAAATRMEGSVLEQHPAVLAAIKEVLNLVSEHYEHSQAHYQHSQTAVDELQSNIKAIPSTIPPLLPSLPPAPAPAPSPPPPLTREVPVMSPYDDSQLHDKLNLLLTHATGAKEALSRMEQIRIEQQHQQQQQQQRPSSSSSSQPSSPELTSRSVSAALPPAIMAAESVGDISEKIEAIHQKMLETGGEVSTMVATQTRLMAEQHESRASEAAEAAIAVEKRMAQKELVEGEIVALQAERAELEEVVRQARREKDELAGQNKRLVREVAKLETAAEVRKQEMREMDVRAERLERRVLEGVLDHAKFVNLVGQQRTTMRSSSHAPLPFSLKQMSGRGPRDGKPRAAAAAANVETSHIGKKQRRNQQQQQQQYQQRRESLVSATERDRAMSLKRVPSAATATSTLTPRAISSSMAVNRTDVENIGEPDEKKATTNLGNAVGMALKKRAPLSGTDGNATNNGPHGNNNLASPSGAVEQRRILSTSHVGYYNSRPGSRTTTMSTSSGVRHRALVLASGGGIGGVSRRHQSSNYGGPSNVKRSQSVRSNPTTISSVVDSETSGISVTRDHGAPRQVSWVGETRLLEDGQANKENEGQHDDAGQLAKLSEDEKEVEEIRLERGIEKDQGDGKVEDETNHGCRSISSASYMYTEDGEGESGYSYSAVGVDATNNEQDDSWVYGTGSIVSFETSNGDDDDDASSVVVADSSAGGVVDDVPEEIEEEEDDDEEYSDVSTVEVDEGRDSMKLEESELQDHGGKREEDEETDDLDSLEEDDEESQLENERQEEAEMKGENSEQEQHDRRVWQVDESRQVVALMTPHEETNPQDNDAAPDTVSDQQAGKDNLSTLSPPAPPPPLFASAGDGGTSIGSSSMPPTPAIPTQQMQTQKPQQQYASDSGLGSEPPTAAIMEANGIGGGLGSDYFAHGAGKKDV